MKKSIAFISLITAAGLLSACKNKMTLDEHGYPGTLMIAVFAGDEPDNTLPKLEAIGRYMEGKIGMKVEYVQTSDYTAVIEALRSKKVHMAHMSPFSYVLASQKGNVDVLVAMGQHGAAQSYSSVIITNKHTGIETIEDLKSRAANLTLSFSDPASASGHLIPRAYLTSIGLDPKTAFKNVVFSSSNGASVMTVHSGKVDIGCTWKNALPILMEKGVIAKEDIRVLWESEPIVSSPVVIRKDISSTFAAKVTQAYLDMATEAPEIFSAYIGLYYKEDTQGFGYVIAQDAMYDGIRQITKGIVELPEQY